MNGSTHTFATLVVDRFTGDPATVYTPPEGRVAVPGCGCGRLLTNVVDRSVTREQHAALVQVEDCPVERENLRTLLVNRGAR